MLTKAQALRPVLVVAALTLAASLGNATVVAYQFTWPPNPTEVAYQLDFPFFNSNQGILTGVKIYFFAEQDVTSLKITNNAAVVENSIEPYADVALAHHFANSANPADVFSGSANVKTEDVAIFDVGHETALGNCTDNPATPVLPANGCHDLSFTPHQVVDYAQPNPIVIKNTDPVYGITTGTGVLGVTGALVTGTNLALYQNAGGVGTWNLSGNTLNNTGVSGGGGNLSFQQISQAHMVGEVDYTFLATPEPSTYALFGIALAGVGLLRRRRAA